MMEEWKNAKYNGRVEEWKNGKYNGRMEGVLETTFQSSNLPTLQPFNIPTFLVCAEFVFSIF
jgi:hypothetical protein